MPNQHRLIQTIDCHWLFRLLQIIFLGGCRILFKYKGLPHRLLLLYCAEQHQQEGGVHQGEEQGGVFNVRGEVGVWHGSGVQHGEEQGEGGVQHGGDGVEQLLPGDEDGDGVGQDGEDKN